MAKSKLNKCNVVDYIMDYESGNLSEDKAIDLFSYLIKTGMIDSLQGSYQRAARAFIESGVIPLNKKRRR
jgi:hypothetical protein